MKKTLNFKFSSPNLNICWPMLTRVWWKSAPHASSGLHILKINIGWKLFSRALMTSMTKNLFSHLKIQLKSTLAKWQQKGWIIDCVPTNCVSFTALKLSHRQVWCMMPWKLSTQLEAMSEFMMKPREFNFPSTLLFVFHRAPWYDTPEKQMNVQRRGITHTNVCFERRRRKKKTEDNFFTSWHDTQTQASFLRFCCFFKRKIAKLMVSQSNQW